MIDYHSIKAAFVIYTHIYVSLSIFRSKKMIFKMNTFNSLDNFK